MNLKKRNQVAFLILLIFLLFAINYSFLDNFLKGIFFSREKAVVERVVDGDTVIVNKNESVRLLGINTPEKGEFYFAEAKRFLEELIVNANRSIEMEKGKEDKDLYKRLLRYVYINRENANLKLVENGFANFYFPSGKDRYYKTFQEAWQECVESNKNLCEKSADKCADCIELKQFDSKKEIIILHNKCSFDCSLNGWNIKDEGRKKFIFSGFNLPAGREVIIKVGKGTNNETNLYWQGETYVWTQTGDTMFLRDKEGKLVLWKNY
ncbi:MAG: thermonuclease family protein [Nanoarchaeota archaeon]|nr:thermonuclease family protein [Nanoarchaeota archaeon]